MTSSIVETIKLLFGDDVTEDGSLNPVFLTIGTRGYQIQSKVLIPDRLGWFSPGPARLLVHQASLAFQVLFLCLASILYKYLLYLLLRAVASYYVGRYYHGPRFRPVVIAAVGGTIYELVKSNWFDPRRDPRYVWDDYPR